MPKIADIEGTPNKKRTEVHSQRTTDLGRDTLL